MNLTTTEKLQLFETTKEQRRNFVNELIDYLNEGLVEPLEIHLQVKAMEDIISQLTTTDEKKNKNFVSAIRYKQLLLEAAEKYGSKSFEFKNAKFETKEAGIKYDYSKTEDVEYFELLKQQKELDDKVKAKEKFLQSLPSKGVVITNEETGETYTVFPPSKKSTTTLSVSFK